MLARQGCITATFVLRPPDTVAARRLACGFLLALLRSKALHAASRQMAAQMESVEAAAVDAAGPAAGEELMASLYVHKYVRNSLPALVHTMTLTACAIVMLSSPDEEPQMRELYAELAAALEDSWALEHAARAMLLQACNPRALHSLVSEAVDLAASAHTNLLLLYHCYEDDGEIADAAPVAARLRSVASGRCVQHVARCMGLAVLCDADGGSAYGLPPELLYLLPSGHGPAGGVMSDAAARQLRAMVCMMQLVDPAPPGRGGALALALRVGWLAVASARSRAGGEGAGGNIDSGSSASGGSGASPPAAMTALRPHRTVPQEKVFPLSVEALHAAWRFLSLPRAITEAASGSAVAEAADWWRLAAAVVDWAVPCSTGDAGRPDLVSFGVGLATVLGLLPDCDMLSLSAEPPPTIAAALDGGLLRCLELMMRRAGRNPQGPEATLLQGLVHHDCGRQSFWSYLAPLLAYGEPSQAAALLATLRKLLRNVDSQALLGTEHMNSKANLHDCILSTITDVLAAVVKQEDDAAAAAAAPGAEPPSPAAQQLLSLLSCAACEWLPELSQSLSHSLVTSGMASPSLLSALLAWLPLLAGRCVVQPYGTAAVSSAPDDGAGGGARGDGGGAADDGGWRALLMEEVGAVALLDASLRIVPRVAELHPESRGPLLCSLVAACCAVAAVLVEAAAVPAPAASAAAKGPSGAAAVSAKLTLPWRPGLLREAAAGLRSCGDQDMAAHAEGLAAYLELGGEGACGALRQAPSPPGPLVSALPPPTEARRLLPGRCANPRCANLAGDSEADLTLKACAGCGAVGYCCRPCQTAHWRAGHKGQCARGRGNGGALSELAVEV
ncbi:hypothetical protein GPECTOR_29g76 [Gonium pectorale]|uniref:phytol kinase n=1 Tax=Gonium pectorale TaxID=33097 RepID=A0A150GEL5_GONPE|nr:hypothetical protein GPECTOR_29g76 [Gonium pectorale]|eukprot:KXZ48301.1 hypothetical protein GPECTOR_29g76 [Gonium pectorale]